MTTRYTPSQINDLVLKMNAAVDSVDTIEQRQDAIKVVVDWLNLNTDECFGDPLKDSEKYNTFLLCSEYQGLYMIRAGMTFDKEDYRHEYISMGATIIFLAASARHYEELKHLSLKAIKLHGEETESHQDTLFAMSQLIKLCEKGVVAPAALNRFRSITNAKQEERK